MKKTHFFLLENVSLYKPKNLPRYILDKITLSIPRGAKVVILGESGSGKSSLAKILKGLTVPSSGRAVVDGLDSKVERQREKIISRVGLVFSNPSQQLVSPRVDEDILFGLENIGTNTKDAGEAVENILRELGISALRKEMVSNLSMGEQLLVAAAGVLAMNPDALIFDEPRAFVGPEEFKRFFSTVMRHRQLNKKTLIWITHHPEDALFADFLLVLHNGELKYFGTPDRFFASGKERFLVPDILRVVELFKDEGVSFKSLPLTLDDLYECLCS